VNEYSRWSARTAAKQRPRPLHRAKEAQHRGCMHVDDTRTQKKNGDSPSDLVDARFDAVFVVVSAVTVSMP
jgi:hypothetical protein